MGSRGRGVRGTESTYGASISYCVPSEIAAQDSGWIEIRDTASVLVRRLRASLSPGLHRVVWDLRRQPPLDHEPTGMASLRFGRGVPPGAPVRTGRYRVQVVGSTLENPAAGRIQSAVEVVDVLPDPQLPDAEQNASVAVLTEAANALRRLESLIDSTETLRSQIEERLVGAADAEHRELSTAVAQLDTALLALRGTGDFRQDWYEAWPANLVLLYRTAIYESSYLPISVQREALEDVNRRMRRARERMQAARKATVPTRD